MMKRLYLIALTALASQSLMLGAVPGSQPRFYGYLRYDAETFTQSGGPTGLYSVDAVGDGRVKSVDLSLTALGGGCFGDGKYYVVDYEQTRYGTLTSVKLKVYDPEGWSLISEKEIPETSIPTTMTYNPVDGEIYGCFFNNESDKMEFGTLNKEDGSTTVRKQLDMSITAMACDHKGTIYIISSAGDLSRYDSASGDFVKIGATGLAPKYIQDATFDYDTKALYWFAMTDRADDAGIYVVDTQSGAASRVTTYATGEKELTGVFSLATVKDNAAPGLVDNLSVTVDAEMKATVSFKMPSVTYGNEALSGSAAYEVAVNGVKSADGNATAGQDVTVTVPVAQGECRIGVTVSTTAGQGPTCYNVIFAGFDTPAKVTDVVATRSESGVKVTWKGVTAGAGGNPIDLENLSYTVTRMPEGAVVATGLTELEAVDAVSTDSATMCYYEVKAVAGGLSSEPAVSNDVVYGAPVELPFTHDFRNKAGLGLIAVDDANADGVTWFFRDNYGILVGDGGSELDDWLIMPPFNLSSGRKYKLTASIGVAMGEETFEVKYGMGNRPEQLTKSLIQPTKIDDNDYWYRDAWSNPGNFTAYLEPETSGEYQIAVHGISNPSGLFLYCCDLALEDAGASGVDEVVAQSGAPAVIVNDGTIVANAESVTVYAVSGQAVVTLSNGERVSVAPGVYLVKAGESVKKLLVK